MVVLSCFPYAESAPYESIPSAAESVFHEIVAVEVPVETDTLENLGAEARTPFQMLPLFATAAS